MPALRPTNILGDSSGSGRFADFFGGLAMVLYERCALCARALIDFATEMPLASVLVPLALRFGSSFVPALWTLTGRSLLVWNAARSPLAATADRWRLARTNPPSLTGGLGSSARAADDSDGGRRREEGAAREEVAPERAHHERAVGHVTGKSRLELGSGRVGGPRRVARVEPRPHGALGDHLFWGGYWSGNGRRAVERGDVGRGAGEVSELT